MHKTILETLAADMAVDVATLNGAGIHVALHQEVLGRRRFPVRRPYLHILSLGHQHGVVVAASGELHSAVEQLLFSIKPEDVFTVTVMAQLERLLPPGRKIWGPQLKYVATEVSPVPVPPHYSLEICEHGLDSILASRCFSHAVTYHRKRPNVLAAIARHEEKIVGAAGATEDSEHMWQVGIDVVPSHRGRGLAACLVSNLTAAILEKGKIPYYSTVPSNIASQRVAATCGYKPMWVEAYAS